MEYEQHVGMWFHLVMGYPEMVMEFVISTLTFHPTRRNATLHDLHL